jgi:hypothetical protein
MELSEQCRAQFYPLLVDVAGLAPGLATLLQEVATGKHIPTIKLVGLNTHGDSVQKVYDLTLKDAAVKGYASDSGYDTALAFGFSQGSETIKGQNPDGSPSAGQTLDFTAGSVAAVDHDALIALAHLHTSVLLV